MATEANLHSQEIGEGVPVLIIHGWKMDGRYEQLDLEPVFTKISGFRRIYVDLPGHGETPANSINNSDDMFAHLIQFVDARLGKSRFLLVGTSYGSYIARALAQRYSKQVDGLMLRVPMVEPDFSLRHLDGLQQLIVDDKLWSTISRQDKKLIGDVHIQTPDYINALKQKCVDVVVQAYRTANHKLLDSIIKEPRRYGLSHTPEKNTDQFLAPTLVMCGRQDEVVGYKDALRLLEFYPRSTYAILDRGSHAFPVDQIELFQTLVRDWLFRVNEWRRCIAKL